MQVRYLTLLRQTGLANKSAESLQWPDGTQLRYATVRSWVESNTFFAERYMAAKIAFNESLEEEAHRRAVIGVERPVYYQGEEVGAVKEYSDALLTLLLRATMPEKYRERVEVINDVRRALEQMVSDPEERAAALAEAERMLRASARKS